MRTALALTLLLAGPSFAEEILSPFEYIKLMTESKLTYQVGAEVKAPLPVVDCPERPLHTRWVTSPDGSGRLLPWNPSAAAKEHFDEAERQFQKKDLEAAEVAYARGLEIDPDYGPGWVTSGDVPFMRGDLEGALQRYRKGLALDPTLPQGHRFAARALLRLGKPEEAEDEVIAALVWDPKYSFAWGGLEEIAKARGFKVDRPRYALHAAIGERKGKEIPLAISKGTDEIENASLLSYTMCKAVWRHEDAFRNRQLGTTGQAYAYTLTEERACAFAALTAELNATESRLAGKGKDGATRKEVPNDEIVKSLKPDTRRLLAIIESGLWDAFLAFELLGARCPELTLRFPEKLRKDMARYVKLFVIDRDRKLWEPTDSLEGIPKDLFRPRS